MRVQRVEVAKLKIDTRYQRDFRPWPKGTTFDENLYEVIDVSRRGPEDKNDYIIRGQRRVELARTSGVVQLWARVHSNMPFEEEARIYALDARGRVGQRPLELFKGDLAYGDEVALQINQICTILGLEIGPTSYTVPNRIEAIISLRKIFQTSGAWVLYNTLSTLMTWTDNDPVGEARTGAFIEGLAYYLETHPKLKDSQLETLFKTPPEVIYLRAKQSKDGFHGGGGMKKAIVTGLNRAAGTRQVNKVPNKKPSKVHHHLSEWLDEVLAEK